MKNYVINSIVLLAGLTIAVLFSSARNVTQQEPVVEQQQVQYTCPMHPEVISDEPGKCPICGMALVEATDSQTGTMMNMMGDSAGMMHDHMMGDSVMNVIKQFHNYVRF